MLRAFHAAGLVTIEILDEELRKQIDFCEMNLAAPWPPIPQMDLMLGASETTWGVEDSFERVMLGNTTLFKRKPN